MNDKFNIMKCIRSDIKKIQKEGCFEIQNKAMDNVAKLSVFCEKEDLLTILADESISDLYVYYILLHEYIFLHYHMIFIIYYLFTESAHINKNKHDTVIEIDMWCDNLKENLECAVKEKRLTDFLVSLSASLSMRYVVLSYKYKKTLIMRYIKIKTGILQNMERNVRGVCTSINNARQCGKSSIVFTLYT